MEESPENRSSNPVWKSLDAESEPNADVELDFSDDDVLLDWEQYAGMRKIRVCGRDCTWLSSVVPCLDALPPSWWYRYSRRQRRALTALCTVVLAVIAAAVILAAALLLWANSGRGDPPPAPPPPPMGDAAPPQPRDRFCEWDAFRLPTAFRPKEYDLRFDLRGMTADLAAPFSVRGEVTIAVEASEPFSCLNLHADLETLRVSGATVGGLRAELRPSPGYASSGIATAALPSRLPAGPIEVAVNFSFPLRPSLTGLYSSDFTDASGRAHRMAVTRFKPTGARKAFPCFDEPAMKAAFRVSVEADEGLAALSNMPPARPSRSAGRTAFAASPPMSPHLVALVVGNLTSAGADVPSASWGAGVPRVRAWGPPRSERLLAPAARTARTAAAAAASLQELLRSPLPLPKLDVVAVPDLATDLEGNWGLLVAKESRLGLGADAASSRRSANSVSRGIAQQWFGGLVTSEFWDDNWLDEGLATYLSYIGAEAALKSLFPDSDVWSHFFPEVNMEAVYAAAKPHSLPLRTKVGNLLSTDEVNFFVNTGGNNKGTGLLRMLRGWMNKDSLMLSDRYPATVDSFVLGIRRLISQDLTRKVDIEFLKIFQDVSLQAEDGQAALRLLRWVSDKHVPLVRVLGTGSLNNSIVLKQDPLLPGGSQCGNIPESPPWELPISFITRNRSKETWVFLNNCSTRKPIYKLQDSQDFLKLNHRELGVYPVRYSVDLWEKLTTAALPENDVFTSSDFAGLLWNSYFQAEQGELPIGVFLRLLQSLRERSLELETWLVATELLSRIRSRIRTALDGTTCAKSFSEFVRSQVLPGGNSTSEIWGVSTVGPRLSFLREVGSESHTPYNQRILYPLLLETAGDFGDKRLTEEAQHIFANLSERQNTTKADDLSTLTLKLVARSSEEGWLRVRNLLGKTRDAAGREAVASALGAADAAGSAAESLRLTLSGEVPPHRAAAFVVGIASRGGESLQAAGNFVKAHWSEFGSLFLDKNERTSQLGALIDFASYYSTESDLVEVLRWWNATAKADVPTELYLNSVVDDIRANIQWRESCMVELCNWLGA